MTASRKSDASKQRAGSGRARVLVIYKKSSYQVYVTERKNKRVQALLAVEDPAVARLAQAHEAHVATMQQARAVLSELGVSSLFRYRKDPVTTGQFDLVISLGGDGTVLRASKSIGGDCPLLAINSAPQDSVGHFCAGTGDDLSTLVPAALGGRLQETRLARMRVAIDDRQLSNRVLNDVLFSHLVPSATTRYAIRLGGKREVHKSSGIWIGTAAGSTAALCSAGGRKMAVTSKRLQFVVREAYAEQGRRMTLIRGFVPVGESLEISSHTRSGRLYLDGSRTGCKAEIGSVMMASLSDEPLTLLGFKGNRR